MKFKKERIVFLTLLALLIGTFSACTDHDPIDTSEYAVYGDVTLSQTINGHESFVLTNAETELVFISQLTISDKVIKWYSPVLEQSFHSLFTITTDDITVTDDNNSPVNSVRITVNNNIVKVMFDKVDGSFDYMSSSTYNISVTTKMKEDLTEGEIASFADGYSGQSLFYGNTSAYHKKSNIVSVVSSLVYTYTYKVKGDPNNADYLYQLNVVYFVPSDITPNDNYRERISTILLKHQLFVCHWMKSWGYEEKSFGLPLDEYGLVDIVTVYGEKPKASYPYSSGTSVPLMTAEINQHYSDNGLEFLSSHTLVITATNGSQDETPFYGYGKWCYALDFPGMSYDLYNIDPITGEAMNPTPLSTNYIGGFLHELGHGLNAPHVGSTYTQKNSSAFGIPLMGSGNTTYGKKPTYLHESTAASMNVCQLSTKSPKTYYNATTASITISKIEINGDQCTVKGEFNTSEPATDVIVRFYNSTETFLGGSHGYTSVAWVVKPGDKTYELTIPIEELRVNEFNYKVGVSVLMDNGMKASVSDSRTYRLINNGSGYTLETEHIVNDGTWEVTVSHALPEDAAIFNSPESLVDGNLSTCLSMVKPGKSYAGITVPVTDEVYAIINFKKPIEFNEMELVNRNFQSYLNTKVVSFYGSNNGTAFTPIITSVAIPNSVTNIVSLPSNATYQYLKMTFDDWDNTGSTMQFAELILKKVW